MKQVDDIIPYDWQVINNEWITDELLKSIDYDNPTTWDIKKGGQNYGPPVLLPSGDKFWYDQRKKLARKMFSNKGKKARLEKQGNEFVLKIGKERLWGTSIRGEDNISRATNVAQAALAAFNAGDIKRTLALEPCSASYSEASLGKTPNKKSWKPEKQKLSESEFKKLQEHKDQIGRAGELIAFEEEKRRLIIDCGCQELGKYVKLVAVNDVASGYDIESSYPGEERCIEVKSSTQDPCEFYISKNELETLKEKGNQGWIYLVLVDKDLASGELVEMLQNPFDPLREPKIELTVESWKASVKGL